MNVNAALLVAALTALVGATALGALSVSLRVLRPAPVTAGQLGPSSVMRISAAATVHAGVAVALLFLITALVVRAATAGRAPWANLHEVSVGFAAALLVAFLVADRRLPVRGLAPIVALLAATLVGIALLLDDRVQPLVPALQEPLLLTVHVGTALLAYGIGALAFAAASAELLQRRSADSLRLLPPAAVCRAAGHRAAVAAFPVLTLAIALGSVWANLAWRSYWNNDPKELAAAATWLVYAAYLHAAGRRDRWGSAAPWLLILGFGGVLFTYLGASLVFPGQHSYAGA